VAATKNVPGLFETFEVACEAAEAARCEAVQKVTRERDHFLNSISQGHAEPTKRLLAALEARRERKVKAAHEECEAACQKAEDELMKVLDA
jgi:hypothetical protein